MKKKEQIDTQLGQQLDRVLDEESVNKHDLVTTPDIADSTSSPDMLLLPTQPPNMECRVFCKHSDINLHLFCIVIVPSLGGRSTVYTVYYTHNVYSVHHPPGQHWHTQLQ